jgi:hypothetical protein
MVGGVRSTVTLMELAPDVSPSPSEARSSNWCVPSASESGISNVVPLTAVLPRSVDVVASYTSTKRPASASEPEMVIELVSVRPSVVEIPVSGAIARFVGAAGSPMLNVRI